MSPSKIQFLLQGLAMNFDFFWAYLLLASIIFRKHLPQLKIIVHIEAPFHVNRVRNAL